jgi:hypothetical protein
MAKPARRIHLYGAGPPKSGTHSVEAIFSETYRAAHEPKRARVIEIILAESFGWIGKERANELWLDLQGRLNLEVNSSHHNVHFIETIVERMPEAKVILTLRDAYDWTDSHIDHDLNRVADMRLTALRDYRFGATYFRHRPEEQILKDCGTYTLRGYLAFWAWTYQKVIDAVPPERLLVVRLKDLKRKTKEVAEFAGVDQATLNDRMSHQFAGLGRSYLLQQIPEDFLESQVRKYAGALMEAYFPEIKSIKDSRAWPEHIALAGAPSVAPR